MSELNEKEIIDAWYRNVGFSSSRVREHWREIQEWLNRKPKTIRYLCADHKRELRQETIHALMVSPFGKPLWWLACVEDPLDLYVALALATLGQAATLTQDLIGGGEYGCWKCDEREELAAVG
jgi:hypothetical protein